SRSACRHRVDVVLQSRTPKYGLGRHHPQTAVGHGRIALLLPHAVKNGGITDEDIKRWTAKRKGALVLELRPKSWTVISTFGVYGCEANTRSRPSCQRYWRIEKEK